MSDITDSVLMRHAEAMLKPETPVEDSIVTLYSALIRICDRHANDTESLPAIESIGRGIIQMLNHDVGRLDKGSIDKAVRDAVQRAGGNSDEL